MNQPSQLLSVATSTRRSDSSDKVSPCQISSDVYKDVQEEKQNGGKLYLFHQTNSEINFQHQITSHEHKISQTGFVKTNKDEKHPSFSSSKQTTDASGNVAQRSFQSPNQKIDCQDKSGNIKKKNFSYLSASKISEADEKLNQFCEQSDNQYSQSQSSDDSLDDSKTSMTHQIQENNAPRLPLAISTIKEDNVFACNEDTDMKSSDSLDEDHNFTSLSQIQEQPTSSNKLKTQSQLKMSICTKTPENKFHASLINSIGIAGQSSHEPPRISSLLNSKTKNKFCEIPYEPHPYASAKELSIFEFIGSLGVTRIDPKNFIEDQKNQWHKSCNVSAAFAEQYQRRDSIFGGDMSGSSKSPSFLMRRRLAQKDSMKDLKIQGNFSANPVNPHKHSDFKLENGDQNSNTSCARLRIQSGMSCAQLRLHNLQQSMKNQKQAKNQNQEYLNPQQDKDNQLENQARDSKNKLRFRPSLQISNISKFKEQNQQQQDASCTLQRFNSHFVANCPSLGESPDDYKPFQINSIENEDQNSCTKYSKESTEIQAEDLDETTQSQQKRDSKLSILSSQNQYEAQQAKIIAELSFSSPGISSPDTKYEDLENGLVNSDLPNFNHQFSCETKATSNLTGDGSFAQKAKPQLQHYTAKSFETNQSNLWVAKTTNEFQEFNLSQENSNLNQSSEKETSQGFDKEGMDIQDKNVQGLQKFPSFGDQMLNNKIQESQRRNRIISDESFGSPNKEQVDTPILMKKDRCGGVDSVINRNII